MDLFSSLLLGFVFRVLLACYDIGLNTRRDAGGECVISTHHTLRNGLDHAGKKTLFQLDSSPSLVPLNPTAQSVFGLKLFFWMLNLR